MAPVANNSHETTLGFAFQELLWFEHINKYYNNLPNRPFMILMIYYVNYDMNIQNILNQHSR